MTKQTLSLLNEITEAEVLGTRLRLLQTTMAPQLNLSPQRFQAKLTDRYRRPMHNALAAGCDGLCVFYPPRDPSCDLGVTVLSDASGPMLSDAALICAAEAAVRYGGCHSGLRLETPTGPIEVNAHHRKGGVIDLHISNVVAMMFGVGYRVQIPFLGEVILDIVFDGNFYGLVQNLFDPMPSLVQMMDLHQQICIQIARQEVVIHPASPYLSGLGRLLWPRSPILADAQSKSLVIEGAPAPRIIPDAGLSARALHRVALNQKLWGQPQRHETETGQILTLRCVRPIAIAERLGTFVSMHYTTRSSNIVAIDALR
ncbi:MAG: proline racemase family protein [Litoreibacter sp.]